MATTATIFEAATNAQRETLKHASDRVAKLFNASQSGGIESGSHQYNVDLDAAAEALLDALEAAGYGA